MTSTEKLNVLFDRWQQSSPENIESFVRDGIINEQKFNSKRVLFLCKEPNQTGAKKEIESSRIWDFREWWKEPLWGGFSICLATWAYGLLSNFNPYDEISDSDLQDAIQCIAFMNIKKTGGLGAAVFQDIHTYVGQHKEYIEEEINIIRPNLIIASITCRNFQGTLFDTSERFSSGHGIDILRWNGIPVLDFYHPSLRGGVCLSYALLKVIFQDKKLQNLLAPRSI